MRPTLYLHWTATPYDWIRPGHYHSIISGDGRVHRLHDYNVDLPAHTYGRNRNSVALSCACMGGVPDPWTQAPTDAQINSLCAEAAFLNKNREKNASGVQPPTFARKTETSHPNGTKVVPKGIPKSSF